MLARRCHVHHRGGPDRGDSSTAVPLNDVTRDCTGRDGRKERGKERTKDRRNSALAQSLVARLCSDRAKSSAALHASVIEPDTMNLPTVRHGSGGGGGGELYVRPSIPPSLHPSICLSMPSPGRAKDGPAGHPTMALIHRVSGRCPSTGTPDHTPLVWVPGTGTGNRAEFPRADPCEREKRDCALNLLLLPCDVCNRNPPLEGSRRHDSLAESRERKQEWQDLEVWNTPAVVVVVMVVVVVAAGGLTKGCKSLPACLPLKVAGRAVSKTLHDRQGDGWPTCSRSCKR
ncbi:hypothetical protein AXG93_4201s1460 [Marchantia polymorpha subsp. ruderalis]|uniref:Uncharacterized protein n=1 Tax=Marchantia polymorpha subsp. ruderalis TaxID=1480154 RepID=A0A176WDK7_MARPO|nr:hypothetical protein AXG93_4201s1460 [Marchantia polymorpha subsp. ruderalis]